MLRLINLSRCRGLSGRRRSSRSGRSRRPSARQSQAHERRPPKTWRRMENWRMEATYLPDQEGSLQQSWQGAKPSPTIRSWGGRRLGCSWGRAPWPSPSPPPSQSSQSRPWRDGKHKQVGNRRREGQGEEEVHKNSLDQVCPRQLEQHMNQPRSQVQRCSPF